MTRFIKRDYDPRVAAALAAQGFNPALARALAARGVRSSEEMETAAVGLLAPAQLAGSAAAAQLLADAIEAEARLLIVADYDCDGATACAVALRGLRMLGAKVDYIVPNRFEYGYGLTPAIVDLAAQKEPDLIVTVDNGIASIDGVARAAELGIEVLVTDHHLPGESLPAAACIVNPNQPGCEFPSKNLAGVGVMFYVLMALRAELRERGAFDAATQPRIDSLLDLVALGTVADVVRLDRNNRILVGLGLSRVRQGRMQPGLAALFQVAGRDAATAGARDFGFAIGPRINAAGRLTDMTVGIECLTTDNFDRALELARQLDSLNRERRELEGDMQLDAAALLEERDLSDTRTLTLFDESWHQGVVGLVASRVKEKHHRPTIAFARSENELKGSGRSIEGVHLRDTLDLVTKIAPGLILKFGGHAMAAGLTIRAEDYETFAKVFEQATRASTEPALFTRTVAVDGGLAAQEITLGLLADVDKQIWGQGFPAPLFANEFRVLEQRLIKDAHLKLALELDGKRFDAIFFRRTERLPDISYLAYRPETNDWNGQRRVQLIIEHAEE
ncbi:MAG: single-stranded-DNA-specific exonuclease RecJ [Burkholderiaceae bacterium]